MLQLKKLLYRGDQLFFVKYVKNFESTNIFCSILYYAGIDSKSNKTNFDGIEDLPLHHKMTVNKNSLVMFDTNQG